MDESETDVEEEEEEEVLRQLEAEGKEPEIDEAELEIYEEGEEEPSDLEEMFPREDHVVYYQEMEK